MALVDWDGNGKKDIQDDLIEYQIYQECMKNSNSTSGSDHSGGMSTFGAILCVVGGLVTEGIVFSALGAEVKDIPSIILIILWLVFSTLIAVLAEKIGL